MGHLPRISTGALEQPLRLVDEMGRDVGGAAPLDARVEEPPWPAERGAVDALVEVMHALDVDRRRLGVAGLEASEDGRGVDQALHEAHREVAAAGHHLADERPAGQAGFDIREVIGPHQPWLVREHVEAGLVQPAQRLRLAAVPPGHHHHVARALREQLAQGIAARAHHGTPGRRMRAAAVEALDEGEEVAPLRAVLRVDEDLGRDSRLRHAQG